MGSLFDIAAGLSQYDDASNPVLLPSSTESGLSHGHIAVGKQQRGHVATTTATNSNQDVDDPIVATTGVLSLVDDTLLTIYAARQPRSTSNGHAQQPRAIITPQRSAPQLMLGHSTTRVVDKQDQRLRSSYTTPMPLQNVFAQSLPFRSASVRTIPPPPQSPPPPSLSSAVAETIKSTTVLTEDPDVVAKKTLREVQDELDQLPADAVASPMGRQRLQRSLTDKYLHHRLNKLPSTPFVQLARKKTQHRIDLLTSERKPPTTETISPSATEPPVLLTIFPADQHAKLVKLATIPDSHVAKLSNTQQQMVQFAKRYDKILRLSRAELASLPVSQTQLLRQLQKQLPQQAQVL